MAHTYRFPVRETAVKRSNALKMLRRRIVLTYLEEDLGFPPNDDELVLAAVALYVVPATATRIEEAA